ncbi:MAG: hypothetical protein FJX76_19740, partial [Armatimonadetes bacterium]|nr:hypothetical protein [Armatimonadota bacterium]
MEAIQEIVSGITIGATQPVTGNLKTWSPAAGGEQPGDSTALSAETKDQDGAGEGGGLIAALRGLKSGVDSSGGPSLAGLKADGGEKKKGVGWGVKGNGERHQKASKAKGEESKKAGAGYAKETQQIMQQKTAGDPLDGGGQPFGGKGGGVGAQQGGPGGIPMLTGLGGPG